MEGSSKIDKGLLNMDNSVGIVGSGGRGGWRWNRGKGDKRKWKKYNKIAKEKESLPHILLRKIYSNIY